MDVGRKIKAARQALGLSQTDLAGQTGVSQPTVANWESGSHAPRHAALSKIASALNTAPASLLATPAPPPGAVLAQHHVPIINPPLTPADIDSGTVIGYMTAACDAARPFAFIAGRDYAAQNITRGDTLIFDRAGGAQNVSGVFLSVDETGIHLDVSRTEKGAPFPPRLVMSISKY